MTGAEQPEAHVATPAAVRAFAAGEAALAEASDAILALHDSQAAVDCLVVHASTLLQRLAQVMGEPLDDVASRYAEESAFTHIVARLEAPEEEQS
jgi:hypothetical protein